MSEGGFTERVVRMRQQAGLIKPKLYVPEDGAALAAEHLELKVNVDEVRIGFPRASSLHVACMRMHVLGTMLDKVQKQFESVKDKLLFGIGNAVQEWIQNSDAILGERRRGWWRCLACRNVLYFGGPPKVKCSKCGAYPEAIVYHEHYMKCPGGLKVTGHPDMFLEKDSDIFSLLEIKTIKDSEFDKLVAPLVQHDWQLQTYMMGCDKDERLPVKTDPNVGYLLYVSKRYRTQELPYKMFTVRRNDALLLRIRTKLNEYAEGIENFPEKLPAPQDACLRGGMDNYALKSCPCKKECLEAFSNG